MRSPAVLLENAGFAYDGRVLAVTSGVASLNGVSTMAASCSNARNRQRRRVACQQSLNQRHRTARDRERNLSSELTLSVTSTICRRVGRRSAKTATGYSHYREHNTEYRFDRRRQNNPLVLPWWP